MYVPSVTCALQGGPRSDAPITSPLPGQSIQLLGSREPARPFTGAQVAGSAPVRDVVKGFVHREGPELPIPSAPGFSDSVNLCVQCFVINLEL